MKEKNEITVGSIVLYNSIEHTVKELAGDVLILEDGTTVSMGMVSLVKTKDHVEEIKEEDKKEATVSSADKMALRNSIEDFNGDTSSVELCRLLLETNISFDHMPVLAGGNGVLDTERLKSHMLRNAMSLGKIDPKTCDACGQSIEE